jgi:hypothetical protein
MPQSTDDLANEKKAFAALKAYRTVFIHKKPLERCIACLFEYARELFWTLPVERRELFFCSNPWRTFAETQDFPSLSYTELSTYDQKQVAAFVSQPDHPFQLDNRLYILAGVYDELKAMADREHEREMEEGGQATFQCPRIKHAGNPEGNIEHVVFTLNYRLGRKRLIKQFEHWLNQYAGPLLERHAVTQRGLGFGLLDDRFSDLIKARGTRLFGSQNAKEALAKGERLSDFEASVQRAHRFMAFLTGCRFDSVRALIDAWVQHEAPYPSQKERPDKRKSLRKKH